MEWMAKYEFYLTAAECEEANRLHEAAKAKLSKDAWYVIGERSLEPDSDMNDSYYLPE